MTLSESREDYLENLLILETRSGGFVRQVDMASRMGFSKASISKAMSSLSAEGYVELTIAALLLHRSTLHCYSAPWQTATP